ncbi:MAG TPA: TIGR03668 family PPOX class F420-dependent oxidoreductase [Ktedonobacteraceae bacterium]|nr:TIGR03668 family PPOX class F420-dependent oxidoreductase [Ktedonobacteraceae bacterium]
MTQRNTLTTAEKAFVEKLRVARLGTTDENGTPYLVPVCYAFDGTYFYTPLDEKPKRVPGTKLRRVRNIETRHEAALLVDQYADDWSQLGYVLIHGRAELIAPTDERHRPAVTLLRERYAQYKSMALEQYPLIMIMPQRITAWGSALSE